LLIWCSSCEKDSIEAPLSWSSIPLFDGMTQIFEINERKFTPYESPKNYRFYLKTVFSADSSMVDNQVFIVEYYSASSLTSPWKLDSISLLKQTLASFVVLEENQWHTKLQFPLYTNKSWSIYAEHIGQEVASAQVTSLFIEKKWQEKVIPLATEITYQSDSSLIHLQKHIEWYAPSVGLLEKYQVNLQYCEDSPDCIGLGIVISGYERKMSRIRLGNTLND
jgi:hypothetical protein